MLMGVRNGVCEAAQAALIPAMAALIPAMAAFVYEAQFCLVDRINRNDLQK